MLLTLACAGPEPFAPDAGPPDQLHHCATVSYLCPGTPRIQISWTCTAAVPYCPLAADGGYEGGPFNVVSCQTCADGGMLTVGAIPEVGPLAVPDQCEAMRADFIARGGC